MKRKIACITLDVESDHDHPQNRLRMFEQNELLDRYISIIVRNDVKVTAFLVTSLLDKYETSIRQLGDSIPVEFGIHAHKHTIGVPSSPYDIEKAVSTFQAYLGKLPAGHRAPVGMIKRNGLEKLLDLGIEYDSSVYPSIRPGKLGYWNLHMPIEPFRIVRGADSLIEIPFAALSTVRLVFSVSYVKLLGWSTYKALMRWFPPPRVASVLSHPYDFYFHLIADDVSGLDRVLLAKDAKKAFDLLEIMIDWLKSRGYEFMYMGEASRYLDQNSTLPQKPIEEWR